MMRRNDQKAEGATLTRRGLLLLGAKGLIMGGLAIRMRQLQVRDGEGYRLLAEENRVNIRLLPPARGRIFDRNGAPLALNRQNYRVVMVREQAGDPEAVMNLLGELIEITPRERQKALKEMRQKSAFVPVAITEHLTWEEFAQVNANAPALPGVDVEVGLSRHYPQGEVLAHVVGYVGRVNDQELERDAGRTPLLQIPAFQIGKTGVETKAEPALRGEAGVSRIEVNAVGRVIRELSRDDGAPGADLQLSVDLDLQRYTLDRLKGQSAAGVVMDIRTGDLLALASSPVFDPNKFVFGISHRDWNALRDDEYRPLHDKVAGGLYPPGSTFKMIVALAALEHGVIKPGENIFCNGRYKLGDRNFHCWRRGGHGQVNLRKSLRESCDVYYYEIAKRVGIERIAEMARAFGLGASPDVALPALKDGLIPTKDWKRGRYDQSWLIGDTLNAGIGQGYVLASPLQLAVMTARLASGTAVRPRLIRGQNGQDLTPVPAESVPVSADALRWVREGMFAVVNDKRGTARRVRLAEKEIQMAGKTGTSQVRRITRAERLAGVTRNEDLPWNRRDHALFVSYAPYDDPKFAVAVVVEHGGSGSKAAAPIARDLMLRTLYGPEPPLSAYPPEERKKIEQQRENSPPADTARSRA